MRRCNSLAFSVILSSAVILCAAQANAQTRLRIVASNLTSGASQSYETPGTHILDGLNPDIVCLQEFNVGDNAAATISNWVTTTFGTGYTYFREPGGQSIPNGIVSRYPIIASGEIDDTYIADRDHAWARIDIPGTVDLYAISVHLKASSGSTNSTMRNNQATVIKNWINANVPAGSYVVVAGDYNTYSNTEACLTTLGSVLVTGSPYPADQAGNANTNAGRTSPYDRVNVNSALNALKTPVVIGTNSFTNGLVFDTRVYTPLSAVPPCVSTDSGATNMQHMAIVKDFMISGGTPTATPTATPTSSPTASPTPSPTPTATPTVTPTPSGSDLIISEYIEGSSNNKALEIYNPTSVSKTLSNYNVKVYFNGSTSASTTITFTGTLAPGATHVTAYTSSASTLLAKANSTFSGSPWNGDDAITLCLGTTVIDSIGRIGQDPGTAWGTTVTTVDSSLRRKAGIVTGDTVTSDAFDPATGYTNAGIDVFTGLGAR